MSDGRPHEPVACRARARDLLDDLCASIRGRTIQAEWVKGDDYRVRVRTRDGWVVIVRSMLQSWAARGWIEETHRSSAGVSWRVV
jgi:hypothetical protein